jgi:UDP-N-acetylmuramoyl-L-alanyl-D-glutamate--2,6-diaminopimelate ligase
MLSKKFSEILKNIAHAKAGPAGDPVVTGISWDSRKVKPGDLFVAIVGHKIDGHQFLDAAVKAGAAALLVQKELAAAVPAALVPSTTETLSAIATAFYGDPSAALSVAGVTGTNGKTTITYMLEAIWQAAGINPGVMGTIDYRWAGKSEPASNTTPLSADIQRIFFSMKEAGVTHAAMEVSSHALAMHRVDGVHFHTAIFTNLTQDHLDYHKTLDNYFEAKAKLFDMAEKGSVVNADDAWGRKLLDRIKGKKISYAIDQAADLKATDVSLSAGKSSFQLVTGKGRFAIQMQIVARYNIYNALAAAGAALSMGVPMEAIQKGLATLAGVPGRLERVTDADSPYAVFVDYAHTDDALRNVMSTLRPITRGRLVTLFGCGGDRDKTKRPIMGEAAVKMSDHVIVTSDNPRSEDPRQITLDIEAGIKKTGASNYEIVVDRAEAIDKAVSKLAPGDVLLLAGKGHETYQIIGDKYFPFDDRDVARRLLKSKTPGAAG